jgi:hypothetical protein
MFGQLLAVCRIGVKAAGFQELTHGAGVASFSSCDMAFVVPTISASSLCVLAPDAISLRQSASISCRF